MRETAKPRVTHGATGDGIGIALVRLPAATFPTSPKCGLRLAMTNYPQPPFANAPAGAAAAFGPPWKITLGDGSMQGLSRRAMRRSLWPHQRESLEIRDFFDTPPAR